MTDAHQRRRNGFDKKKMRDNDRLMSTYRGKACKKHAANAPIGHRQVDAEDLTSNNVQATLHPLE